MQRVQVSEQSKRESRRGKGKRVGCVSVCGGVLTSTSCCFLISVLKLQE